MIKTFLVSLVLLSNSTAFAQSAVSNKQLQASIADIETSLASIKKDLKRASKLLDNKAILGMFQRLDDVAQEVSELRGVVEEQGHLQQRLQKRQRELYLDLDRRLREIELKATAQPKGNNNPIPVPPLPVVVLTVAAEAPVPDGVVVESKQKTAVKKPVVTAVAEPMSEERKEYQKSFDLLKEGRYKKAKTAFKDFLNKYPNSNYASNAQYWTGEVNYVTRQFATAMQEFKRVITQYPASNKVPDAMLKLGYTFYETHQTDSAKQILSELVKRFPKSTVTRLAKKRLKRMKKEGF